MITVREVRSQSQLTTQQVYGGVNGMYLLSQLVARWHRNFETQLYRQFLLKEVWGKFCQSHIYCLTTYIAWVTLPHPTWDTDTCKQWPTASSSSPYLLCQALSQRGLRLAPLMACHHSGGGVCHWITLPFPLPGSGYRTCLSKQEELLEETSLMPMP